MRKHYKGHTYSFNHRGEISATLSSHLQSLREQNKTYKIHCYIIDRAQEFKLANQKCRFSIKKRFYVILETGGCLYHYINFCRNVREKIMLFQFPCLIFSQMLNTLDINSIQIQTKGTINFLSNVLIFITR